MIPVESRVVCSEEIGGKSKVDEETTIQNLYPLRKSELFLLFFLADDENQSVEVVETQEIDFEEVVQRLKRGESVFIKRKSVEQDLSPKSIEDAREPWYFTHM